MDDPRGGAPPNWQMGQIGGQQADPAVPSLLQMAQGDGGGLAAGWQSDPGLNNGAPFRAITSPEDQNWSDLQGNPIHMGGPAPAYNPGTTQGGYNAVFDPRAPSASGGYFTMEDYLNQAPSPMEAAGWGPQSADGRGGGSNALSSGGMQSPQRGPRAGGVNNNALSTNNWRLLGNDPDLFMINGTVVNRRQIGRDLAPKSVMGTEGTGFAGYNFMGGGQWGTPVGSQGLSQGYIGADNWATSSTPTY